MYIHCKKQHRGVFMLKKLVKYGNSHALVLDQCILALLDIHETDLVKLKIEGDCLIVKGEKNTKPTEVLKAEIENIFGQREGSILKEIVSHNFREFSSKIEKDSSANELLKKWLPGTENAKNLQEGYARIFQEYHEDLKVFATEQFQKECELLRKKYPEGKQGSEYAKELMSLRLKYCPKVMEMDKKMVELTKSLGYPYEL